MRQLIVFCALFIFLCAGAVEARHDRIDTADLDNDVVEELFIPVLFGVTPADMVPDFGDPRGGGTRSHEGQDMRAPLGTPIVSPTEAVVLRTGSGASAGKYVYTANPGGEVFRYMHLDYVADLDRGDELDVGDFIGTVGDTGNAPDGVYHLHFEIRTDDGAIDPFVRLTDTFTVKEKIDFLDDIFKDIRNDEEYAAFLVETFPDVFEIALREAYSLPEDIEAALDESGLFAAQAAEVRLREVLAQIPKLLTMELSLGNQGATVTLLQLYIIYSSEGAARNALARAGATGYFGPITEAAVIEMQLNAGIVSTGVYNAATREALVL